MGEVKAKRSKRLRSSKYIRVVFVHGLALSVLCLYLSANIAQARAIKLTQNFLPGSSEAFEKALSSGIDTVILDVTGGYLIEGMEIGRIIRAHRLNTVVPEGARCLSACAEAFLGGVGQRIDGVVAFHVPRVSKLQSRKQAFGMGVTGGTLTAIYRHEMGYGFALSQAILKWTADNRLLAFDSVEKLNSYRNGASDALLPHLIEYKN